MKVAAISTTLLIVLLVLATAKAATRQHVLLLLADDAGFQMSVYNDSAILTPNFDALALRSVVFRNGYTSVSSCSPSRSVLLTGQPQHQNGMYGLVHDASHFSSFDNVQSLPSILAQNNIRTGIIGKYHLAPSSVYKFEYDASSNRYSGNQVARNITYMRQHVRQFLQGSINDSRPFFLYIAWADPHRCDQKYGEFCEKFGNGDPGMGRIPDWEPQYYNPSDIKVPYYLPDTPITRQELANMYTTYSRMDQGLRLFMKELEDAGFLDNTLVLYTSDNGIPFPNAKTTLYEPGMGVPMLISNPHYSHQWGRYTDALASTMDFVPTILDWFSIPVSTANVTFTGKSLLPVTNNASDVTNFTRAFSSHNFHEVTMYYPMRAVRTPRYRLINNLNHHSPYGIASDVYSSPTFQDILNCTRSHQKTHWFKTLDQYYHRPRYELYDLEQDPQELVNLADDPGHQVLLNALKAELEAWQEETRDPWQCLPADELIGGSCFPLDNGESEEEDNVLLFQSESTT